MMNQKQFIVIEGIDGSGKSTQAELLIKYFLSRGEKAVISPEPSSGIIGNLIRQALKKRIFFTADRRLFDEQMAYLFAADRHDHLYNDVDGVYKLINDGFHVISTRYYFSSLAYNSPSQKEFEFISKLNHKFPPPDLTIYLQISVETSLKRTQDRSLKEIYETQEKLINVKANYDRIFNNYQSKLLKINGTQERSLIHQQIINFLELTA
jgi:dTMP kinase